MSRQRRVAEIVEPHRPGDVASLAFDIGMIVLIALNVAALMLETVESIGGPHAVAFYWFEQVSLGVFTIEYLLRLWSAPAVERFAVGRRPRLACAASPMMLVDLAAILPGLLPFVGFDGRALRTLRLMRVFRVLKMARYSHAVQALGQVLREKAAELAVLLFGLMMMLIAVSTLMYYAEHDAQPEVFSSIPATLWWGIVTLTTVGYGDMAPVTPLGRALGGCIALLGIFAIALPTGVLASGFTQALARPRTNDATRHAKETEP